MKFSLLFPLAIGLGLMASHAGADPLAAATSDAMSDPDLARLAPANGHSIKWNYVPSGKTDRYGHSEVLIAAPLPYVRDLVVDFAHYKDFSAGKFRTSRIIDKSAASTDVYIQVPAMHGMVMLWQVMRFGAPKALSNGNELVEGTFVRGNVKASNIVFSMRAVGDKTILKADVVVVPDFAAPQSMIDEELRDAAQNAVDAVQIRAQQKYLQVNVALGSVPDAGSLVSTTP